MKAVYLLPHAMFDLLEEVDEYNLSSNLAWDRKNNNESLILSSVIVPWNCLKRGVTLLGHPNLNDDIDHTLEWNPKETDTSVDLIAHDT